MHATRTGQECEETDSYRCIGCLVEQRVVQGRRFPVCPVCSRDTTWVRKPRTKAPTDEGPRDTRRPRRAPG